MQVKISIYFLLYIDEIINNIKCFAFYNVPTSITGYKYIMLLTANMSL